MTKLLTIAAAAAYLLSLADASPMSARDEPTAQKLLGFDETLVKSKSSDAKPPTITYMKDGEFFNRTATEAAPFTLSEEDLENRFINGNDDRYQYTDTNYPYNAVGKLYWDNGVFCSAALVGPRHVLTAKHCLVEQGVAGYFAPGFDNGDVLGRGMVTDVFTSNQEWGSPCGWKGDWAVLVIDNRLGDALGYFGVKLPDASLQDQPIFTHVGYPGDLGGNRPYRVDGNTVQSFRTWDCDSTGPYYTDTDCQGGQSGGPHWEGAADGQMIWGTLSVTFDGGDGTAWSGWGSGNEMLDAVLRYRNEFP